MKKELLLTDEEATLKLGAALAHACGDTVIIYLFGNLGAGKTTLTRGFLRGLGYEGKVKSPTYTLVEPYEIQNQRVYHFDLYRLHDPQELEFIGINDYFIPPALVLIEWPEHGEKLLPTPDLSCYIESHLKGRQIRLEAHSNHGITILEKLPHYET